MEKQFTPGGSRLIRKNNWLVQTASLCFVVLFSFLFSCKKASGPANGKSVNPKNPDSLVSLSATVNGQAWQTDSVYTYRVASSANDSGTYNLLITAINKPTIGATSIITFNITRFAGIGTYVINPPVNAITYYTGSERHYANFGQVAVTNVTAYSLEGNFNFTADSVTVQNGAFHVPVP
jgi:hypothetical protein